MAYQGPASDCRVPPLVLRALHALGPEGHTDHLLGELGQDLPPAVAERCTLYSVPQALPCRLYNLPATPDWLGVFMRSQRT